MFSWFKKKEAPAPAPPASSPAAGTRDRDEVGEAPETPAVRGICEEWDLLIADALKRVDALVERATAECGGHVVAPDFDYGPLTRLWTKTQAEVHQIREEVQSGWDRILDRLTDGDEPAPHWVIRREGNKRDNATCEVEARYWLAERSVMSRAAMTRKARAEQLGTKEARDAFAATGGVYLGQWAARNAWVRMNRAGAWIDGFRNKKDVPLSLLEEYDAASRAFYTQSLRAEAEYVPELAPYVDAKIAAYMKSTEKKLRQFWQWREKQKGAPPA